MQPNTAFTSNSTIETNTNNINSVTSFDKTQSTEASNPKSWFNYQLDGPTTGFAAVAAANLTADRVAPLSNSLNPWGCVGLLVGADSSSDYTPNLSQGLREPSATKGVIESGSDHNEWDLKDRSPEDDITNRNDYTGMQNSNWNDVMLQNQYVSSGLEIGHDLKFGKSMLSNKVDDLEIGQGMPMDWNDATCNSSSGWTYPPHGGTYNQGKIKYIPSRARNNILTASRTKHGPRPRCLSWYYKWLEGCLIYFSTYVTRGRPSCDDSSCAWFTSCFYFRHHGKASTFPP